MTIETQDPQAMGFLYVGADQAPYERLRALLDESRWLWTIRWSRETGHVTPAPIRVGPEVLVLSDDLADADIAALARQKLRRRFDLVLVLAGRAGTPRRFAKLRPDLVLPLHRCDEFTLRTSIEEALERRRRPWFSRRRRRKPDAVAVHRLVVATAAAAHGSR